MALIQYGDFLFNIDTLTYDELRRKSSVRWARQKIVGGDDRLQAAGLDNDTIRLSGTFYPQVASWVGGTVGTKSLDDLRNTMKEMQTATDATRKWHIARILGHRGHQY